SAITIAAVTTTRAVCGVCPRPACNARLLVMAFPRVGGPSLSRRSTRRRRKRPSAEQCERLFGRPVDAGVQRRVPHRVEAAFAAAQLRNEIRELLQVLHLVDDDELLVLQAERVQQKL